MLIESWKSTKRKLIRKNTALVYLLTLGMLITVFCGYKREDEWDGSVSLFIEVLSEGYSERIQCWEKTDGDVYFFLPSYLDFSKAHIYSGADVHVEINGQKVGNGLTCRQFQLNTAYDLCYMTENGEYRYKLTFIQSKNVPTVYIDVPTGNMDYIHEAKGNKEPGIMRLYDSEGGLNYRGILDSVNGRGNATWQHEKKPYSLELSKPENLLGMGAAKKWILLANSYDSTNIRNKLACDLARAMEMPYSPQCEWVDLYLNGEYAGLYLLSEKNEVHTERIDFAGEEGFLVSQELQYRLEEQNYPFVDTKALEYGAYRIHYSNLNQDTVLEILQSVENAILSETGIDKESGKSWKDWIDLESWVKKYLLEEVLGNFDAGVASQYYYYLGNKENGKLFASPAWDYDNILGTQHWQIQTPYAIIAGRQHIFNELDAPYYYALYQKPEFYECVVELYRICLRPLLLELLEDGIENYSKKIEYAVAANQIRWETGHLADDKNKLESYLAKRLEFFDDLWLEDKEYCFVHIWFDINNTWGCYAVRPGEILPQLPQYQDTDVITYLGWYDLNTEKPVEVEQPIYNDMTIYLKSEIIEDSWIDTDAGPQKMSGEEDDASIGSIIPLYVLSSILLVMCCIDWLYTHSEKKL